MIRETGGTVYITAGCFLDRFCHAPPGVPFVYATGKLGSVDDKDAQALRKLVAEMTCDKAITASTRQIGEHRFEYLATKRAAK